MKGYIIIEEDFDCTYHITDFGIFLDREKAYSKVNELNTERLEIFSELKECTGYREVEDEDGDTFEEEYELKVENAKEAFEIYHLDEVPGRFGELFGIYRMLEFEVN